MKIALVQFYPYHEEVLAPQIHYLLPENQLFVAAPQSIFSNDYIRPFISSIEKVEFASIQVTSNILSRYFTRITSVLQKYLLLKKCIKNNCIQQIIFNTITRPFHIKLIKFFLKKVECVHIIHNAQYYTSPQVLKNLMFFKKNLFISNDVFNFFLNLHSDKIDQNLFNWFFPSLSGLNTSFNYNKTLEATDKINIVVPGSVNNDRRNYPGLFKTLEKYTKTDQPFQITLLGKISTEDQQYLSNLGLTQIIKTFTEYVPGDYMLNFVESCDAILFLVDKTIGKNCSLYNKYKATGSSTLCLSFGVPCIVSDDFTLDHALKEKAVVYPGTEIDQIFNAIIEKRLTKEYFNMLKKLPIQKEYDTIYQRAHYRELLGVTT